ncbi:hypothetical protein [Yersinia phage fHe-Yen9-04]|uniref:Uncharacterized protein n=2 Tax=Eneladusvirus Yen904 TaxID=2560849 RepID=A0A2C9CXI8_9CAUD|nr:tail tube protein [Yersinia phage fHe-Yen9-04]SOK58476.1 hypothetical protein [Yersinia phage fHe-Yen9-04]SOK59011.1 hypothetical protein [Yersinia phage fHe-Yen9-03]VUE36245.1 hypothetical protein [Yersinia phage fHe-Yen9-04]
MSNFLDSLVTTGTQIVSDVVQSATIIKNPPLEQYNAAQRVFSSAGEGGFSLYTLPKLKYSFIVEFIIGEFAKNFIETQLPDTHTGFDVKNVSCFVRDVNLPSTNYVLEQLNQYNKTRYQAGKVEYKPVMMTFYDTADGAAYLLADAYKKYYYGDFFIKSAASFRNDVLSSPIEFEAMGSNWGRSVMNNGNSDKQYFFKQINIYEIDNDTYTCHNMFNVFIEDIEMETKSMESSGEPSIISLTLRYEGTGNLGPDGYNSISVPTVGIGTLITDTTGLGKSGFFKYFGQMDDKTVGILTVGKIIRAGTAGYDIITSVGDILNGNISPDTIRNIGSAVVRGANSIGLGSIISSANEKFGLGNILGDF